MILQNVETLLYLWSYNKNKKERWIFKEVCDVLWSVLNVSLEFNISTTKQSLIRFLFLVLTFYSNSISRKSTSDTPTVCCNVLFMLTMMILYFWDIKFSSIFLLNCYCCSTIVRRIWRSYETRRVLCMTVKLCKYILYFSKTFIIALRKEKSLRKLEIKEMSILVIQTRGTYDTCLKYNNPRIIKQIALHFQL